MGEGTPEPSPACQAAEDEAPEGAELAPLARPQALEQLPIQSLDPGPVDYIVKCTSGRFEGRFLHVNRKAGEIFGADAEDPEVTLCVEDAGLAKRHAKISFDPESYHYFLEDVGSPDGTWLAVRTRRSIEISGRQELRAGNAPTVELDFGAPIPPADEVAAWLAIYQLRYLATTLLDLGLQSLDDVRAKKDDLVELVSHSFGEAEDHSLLTMAVSELDRNFPPGKYERRSLKIVLRPDADSEPVDVAECQWAGGFVALAPGGSAAEPPPAVPLPGGADTTIEGEQVLGVIPGTGWKRSVHLKFGFSFGRYYVHWMDDTVCSSPECFVSLGVGQRHWLQPQDAFKIGSLEFEVLRFNCGVHAEQGVRPTMEDEDIAMQDLAISHWRDCSFFGVYDGHGGRECAAFVRRNLHKVFVETMTQAGGLDNSTKAFHDIYDCLTRSFLETDRHFLNFAKTGGNSLECGSAAVVVCVIGGWVWCANCGDSRALLCRQGKAIQLSLDHRPCRTDEAERIKAAGGWVAFGRVMGRLALTRAFGDVDCKVAPPIVNSGNGQNMITAEPEIRLERITPQDEFLLLGCDGVFDVFTTQEVVDFTRSRLAAMPPGEQDPKKVARDLVHEAIHERGSRDNVTAMVVSLKRTIAI